jgi:hypothetical protein
MICAGIVKNSVDPAKRGRVKMVIPEISGPDCESDWIPVVWPPGDKGTVKNGDTLVVVARVSNGKTFAYAVGQSYSSPQGVGSLAPLASIMNPAEFSKTKVIGINPANQEKLRIQILGTSAYIEIDSVASVITINPGNNDIILTPGGARVAVEGDPVQVNTKTGRGRITQGSAPMQARLRS